MSDQSARGIGSSPRFRGYSEELRELFAQLCATFRDCQGTFAAIIDANVNGPSAGSVAELEREDLLRQDPCPPRAPTLVPMQSYFYLSTAAEHMGGLGALYAAEEVAYPPPLLIRGVVEHAARVAWLLDPEIEAIDRAARGYLEELWSRLEYKKTIGRLAGKESAFHRDAVDGLKEIRTEAAELFGEKVPDKQGQHRLRSATWIGPGDCVAALIGKLTADAPLPDVRGVYDRVSNLCHPTFYTHTERWRVIETDRKREIASTTDAQDHDRPARLAVAAFSAALNHLVSYNEWPRDQLEALQDRLGEQFAS